MNDKIVIEVIVPQIDSSYDIFIPINLKIFDVTNLIGKSISDMTNGDFKMNSIKKLYDKNSGNEIDCNLLVKDSNLKNGSKVVLI